MTHLLLNRYTLSIQLSTTIPQIMASQMLDSLVGIPHSLGSPETLTKFFYQALGLLVLCDIGEELPVGREIEIDRNGIRNDSGYAPSFYILTVSPIMAIE